MADNKEEVLQGDEHGKCIFGPQADWASSHLKIVASCLECRGSIGVLVSMYGQRILAALEEHFLPLPPGNQRRRNGRDSPSEVRLPVDRQLRQAGQSRRWSAEGESKCD